MQLSELRKELEFNTELVQLIETLKNIAASQYHVMEKEKERFDRFMDAFSEFFRVVNMVDVDDPLVRATTDVLGVVVVTSDSGFMGGLNQGVIRAARAQADAHGNDKVAYTIIGEKGCTTFADNDLDFAGFGGVNQETANIIATFAQEHLAAAEMEDTERLYSFIHETITDILNVTTPDFNTEKKQRRMAFIGPTGVGKTTTLAKIAANYLATQSKSIALITIDTYRIAAVEQLKVYGEIMHLPVEVVLNPQQLRDALEKHSDKELILIDTAGIRRKARVKEKVDTFSMPIFLVALLAVLFFSITLRELGLPHLPTQGMWDPRASERTLDQLLVRLILPTMSLAAIQIAIYARFVRASMLEVKNADFIRTARAKGLHSRRIIDRKSVV